MGQAWVTKLLLEYLSIICKTIVSWPVEAGLGDVNWLIDAMDLIWYDAEFDTLGSVILSVHIVFVFLSSVKVKFSYLGIEDGHQNHE